MKPQAAEQLAAFWTRAQPAVAAFVRTLLTDADQAQEVLQRVAITLVRKFDQYDPARPFNAWAIGFAKVEVVQFRREKATDRHVFDDDLVGQFASYFEQISDDAAARNQALADCLQKVDGRSRRALELYYGRQLRTAGVADELGLSSGAVRTLLCRVRDALRICIEGRLRQRGENQ